MSYLTNSNRGVIPVILTAPHGGSIRPFNPPDRTYGTKVRDTYTKSIIKEINLKYDYQPYYLYSNLHRIKLDFNRPIEEGAQGNEHAEFLWKEWHDTISKYKDDILHKFGRGLLVEIHSHNNSDEFEIGYNLSANGFRELMETRMTESRSSIDGILIPEDGLYGYIFGDYSIYETLKGFGYKMFIPQPKENYFNGGYTIEKYSGEDFGTIQIEVPVSKVKENFPKLVNSVYESIRIFYEKLL